MDPKLDKQLCEEFPILYADRYKPIYESAMGFGFCIGNGWFKLIYDLSKDLSVLINKLSEEQKELYRAAQVKEKFGVLRYYMANETPEMTKLIMAAECKSAKICEKCGDEGLTRYNPANWLKTLCSKHAKELNFTEIV